MQSIDSTRLERDRSCLPVYPWNFARTDKHLSYLSGGGPGNGTNVDDYYSPETNSVVVNLPGVTTPMDLSCATITDPSQTAAWTNSFENIQCYDTLKVNAILNEICGKTHLGKSVAPVPAIVGMNFQAVSVGEKLIETNVGTGGYVDSQGTPTSFLANEIQFVDASIAEMVAALSKQKLLKSTLIVISAKHGQSPIDPNRYFPIPGPSGNNGMSPGIGEIFRGPAISTIFNLPGLPPDRDPGMPDIVVTPNFDVVYTGSSAKLSEHGGTVWTLAGRG